MEFLAALLIGLLGSGHCLVMCGGIASALQMMMPEQNHWQRLRLQLALSFGRISSYAFIGGLVGWLGYQAMGFGGAARQLLQILAGLMLVLMALYVAKLSTILTGLEQLGSKFWRHIQPFSKRLLPLDTLPKAFAYGWCWGYLPCGLVYSSLSWSLASGSFFDGALWMVYFGLGTLPALLVAGQAAATLQRWKNKNWVRYTVALLLATYGCHTISLAVLRLFS
ncbi:MAG: sulfite exporter TauE/SafE family protein [Gammaproteobacteria bacterium]|nr:sulfite exporter TauE/SafE family protein [Gammaproteobacteria bacterium]MBU2224716.1 sulfite exporter TauE/SafE family protein [Gammaproteobacteria bacterium]